MAPMVVVVRLRLLLSSLAGGGMLLLILCLGAQNLDQRTSLNLATSRTAPLPTGFLVGLALVVGVISGGCTAALLMPQGDQQPGKE